MSRTAPGPGSGRRAAAAALQPRWPDRLAGVLRRRGRGGRRARRVRLLLAAVLMMGAGALAIAPDRVSTASQVVTIAKDLPVGSVLSRSVLRTSAISTIPDGAFRDPAALVGRTLAGPMRRGEIVTDVRLVAPDGPDPGPGRVAVPIRPTDPATVELLSPGMHVAIVTARDGPIGGVPTPTVLSDDAVVLTVAAAAAATDRTNGRLVVVGVPAGQADRLAAAALGGELALRFG
jgi:Flp pilus assembly protein CpaB